MKHAEDEPDIAIMLRSHDLESRRGFERPFKIHYSN